MVKVEEMLPRKGTKCLLVAVILVCLFSFILLKGKEVKSSNADNPFNQDNASDSKLIFYPTRAIAPPTLSAERIREMMLKNVVYLRPDPRANDVEADMPANPFGNVIYKNDLKPHLHNMNESEADALMDNGDVPLPGLKFAMPKLEGVNIVSMSLYGATLKYTMGAIKNAELIKQNFPRWSLRVYTETPSDSPRFGIVPQTVLDRLRVLGAELHYIDPKEESVPPMMWRFLVADDELVERFIVRDSDGRLTARDAAAVYAWVQSDAAFHCVRDHPSHAGYAIRGGMWGGRTKMLRNILRRTWREMMYGSGNQYLDDMNFLNSQIWPKVQHNAYCSDSVSCDHWPGAHPFPVARHGYEHVGEVYNENDLGRELDISILRQAGENPKCLPPNSTTL